MIKIVTAGVGVALLCNFMQTQKMELTQIVRLSANVVLLIFVVSQLEPITMVVKDLATRAHIPLDMVKIILKSVGIAYIGQFGATICTDAGEGSLARMIETATKVGIVITGLPVFLGLLDLITTLL